MSLDVYLTMPTLSATGTGIFVRENGSIREITRTEWDERFPDREPVVVNYSDDTRSVYSANITHNLGKMAEMAGLYQVLWRPDENGITHAHQLIEPLRVGLERLRSNPAYYSQFNASNGWGTYDNLLAFVEQYLEACEDYQTATVNVSR